MKGQANLQLTLYMQMWMYQFLGLCILSVARIVYLCQHASLSLLLQEHADSIPLFLWNSWRFDIQVITYVSLPVILGILVVSFLRKESVASRYKGFMQWYYTALLTLLAIIVIAEFYFYSNFNSRYNIVFFDFFDEGPVELLRTMWQDYPIISILAAVLAIGGLIWLAGKGIKRVRVGSLPGHGIWSTMATSLLIAGVTFVFLRGSVTRYTLQVEAFMVSTNEEINQSVPNALYLLKKAYKEKSNSFKLYSDESLLHESGFETLDEAISVAGFPASQADNNQKKLEEILFARQTTDSVMINKESPNVVIILNESWSRFLLEMDKGDSLDLLCSLRKHLAEDFYFRNVQSVRNGTIYSLENLTLAMPYPHFFNSRYRFKSVPASIAYPFKQEGYNTAFITGMDPTWENVQEGLSYQSFDTIIGRQNILHAVDNSTTSAIGVYDEFLYQYIQGYLEDSANDKPKFILALTTTNHPPFTFPDNMQLPPLNDLWYSSPCLVGDEGVLYKYGVGAQYANKSLGDFLDNFKQTPLVDNTIVVAIGDHNVRSVINYQEVSQRYKHAVPMYLYLPETYGVSKEQKEKIESRFGSHFDILPTLAPLCLTAATSYLAIGQNLLDTTRCNNAYYSYNELQLLSPEADKQDSLMRLMKTRELLMKIYYQQKFRE